MLPVIFERSDTILKTGTTIWLCLLLFASVACTEAPSFHLETFLPGQAVGVRLNESLVFRFSHEIDCTTVSSKTAAIVDSRGRPAAGSWEVRGQDLLFLPRLPMRGDCTDAGLAPGREYSVRFEGFPSFCALRSTSGSHLDQRLVLTFRTVAGETNGLGRFVDPKPESGPNLISVGGVAIEEIDYTGVRVKPGIPLSLTFSEPLYPGSLTGGKSKIYMINVEGTVDVDQDALGLCCRFGDDPLTVLVEPEGGFLQGKEYKLYRECLIFTDYGGKTVEECRFDHLWIVCPPG